jgi:putative ABC transport system ATP-binding protein
VTGGVELVLDGVSKRFTTPAGQVDAVTDVDLRIAAGTSLAITGPSGCGKSTLLSMIGALEPPTRGRIDVAGHIVSDMTESRCAAVRRELIGFVFQSDNLQPFMTAVENISLQLALAGVVGADDRAVELLDTLGLGGAAGKYPDQMSGGERQRIAVARAVVHRPRLILADEPTGALDVTNSLAVIDLLRTAQAEVGATLIVITHDLQIAERFDRRIALLDGRIVHDSVATSPRLTDPTSA